MDIVIKKECMHMKNMVETCERQYEQGLIQQLDENTVCGKIVNFYNEHCQEKKETKTPYVRQDVHAARSAAYIQCHKK
jgi:hypothetical protein